MLMLESYYGLSYTEPLFGGGSVGLTVLTHELIDRTTALLADESPSSASGLQCGTNRSS